MWHVTDGDLHAYLDGALALYPGEEARRIRSHLETCADCRARLQEEERVRERAEAVLARTDPPSIDVPPFEALRHRAAAGSGDVSGSGARSTLVVRLGWAASVLVALGVGWMVGREPAVRNGSPASPAVSADAGPAGDVDVLRPTSPSPDDRMAGADVDPSEGEDRMAGREADAGSASVAGLVDTAGERPASVTASEQPVPVAEEQAVSVAAAEAQERVGADPPALVDSIRAGEAGRIMGRTVRAGTDAPLVGAQVMVEGTSVGAVTDEEGRYVLSPVPAGSRTLRLLSIGHETVTETVTVRPGGTEVVDLSSPASTIALEGIVVSGLAEVPPDSIQRAEARASAVARDREPSVTEPEGTVRTLLIPGLEVLRVGWTEVAPGVEGLLVVQQLVGDTTRLELRFGGLDPDAVRAAREALRPRDVADPAPAEPPASILEETLPEGVSQVEAALPGGTGWVILRGRLPPDRLRRLLDLIR